MHIVSDDKLRRKLNFHEPSVKEILPEYFTSSFPKFISLLEKYYEFLDENESTELLHHLLEARDITQVDLELLTYIENELLLGNAFIDRRMTAEFSSEMLRAKGTKYSVQWFFRAFYNLDAEVVFPKENRFMLNDELSALGSESLRFLTDDKLYQIFAVLVKVGVPISEWKELYKKLIHPAGMYLAAKLLIIDVIELGFSMIQPNVGLSNFVFGEQESILSASLTTSASGEIEIVYTAPIVYSLTATPDQPNETNLSNVVFNISGDRIPNGNVYFYIQHVSTDNADFVDSLNVPTFENRAIVPISGEAGSYSIDIAQDSATEGVQTFNAYIYNQPYPNGDLLATVGVAITDTSTTPIAIPTYQIISSDITEGQSLEFTIAPTNPNGENVNWEIFGNDVVDRFPTKTGSESNILSSRTVTVPATTSDPEYRGPSNGYIRVTGENSGSQATLSFQLLDQTTGFTIELDPSSIVIEGNDIGFRVISTNSIDESASYGISGSGVVGRVAANDRTGTISGLDGNNGNATSAVILVPTSVDATTNGDQTGTITVTGVTSGVSESINFTLKDVSNITYTITGPSSITEPSS